MYIYVHMCIGLTLYIYVYVYVYIYTYTHENLQYLCMKVFISIHIDIYACVTKLLVG